MANEGINFSALVYGPAFDTYSVDVTFTPQAGAGFSGRGIFSTQELNVLAENNSIYSDQRTILDVLDVEFAAIPKQGDHVTIPRDCNGVDQGEWVIVDSMVNGGGQTTFTLRKWEG